MGKLDVGDVVPTFNFECTDSKITSLNDLKGQNIILYFYPKDNTPGCSLEGRDFTALNKEFTQLNTRILGVSRDSLKSHDKFCLHVGLTFPLIADTDEKLCQYFGVLIEKNMFLRIFLGIDRSTFLIDTNGVIQHVWRKVKAKGHASEVLEMVRELRA